MFHQTKFLFAILLVFSACDDGRGAPDELRLDPCGGTESGGETGGVGLVHICGSNGAAYKETDVECDVGYEHICWLGEDYIDPDGSVCCTIGGGAFDCGIVNGDCAGWQDWACDFDAMNGDGDGDGDGDPGDPAQVCGTTEGNTLYVEHSVDCAEGTIHWCWIGDVLDAGTISVCCDPNTDICVDVVFGQPCPDPHVLACDMI